jgi:O-antigen/teichoic acid export membrane protein
MKKALVALLRQRTSIAGNLSANLIGKILSAVVGLACIPVFIKKLGIEGYGVVGIWMTLEALAALLDLGLSPTLTRELSRTGQHPEEAQRARDLVRTLEVFYGMMGLLVGLGVVIGAPLIANHWLKSAKLSPVELVQSVQLIGVLVFCRWPISFYSSGLNGLERQVLLSWITLAGALLRNLGAIVVLVYVSPTIFAFLSWQIAVNISNVAALAGMLWWCLPESGPARIRPGLAKEVWKFAGGVAAIAMVSVLLTDLDKIVVSGLVSLDDFGYYTLASRMAATLYILSSSVFSAVYPALVRLAAERDEHKFAKLYHYGAQSMSLLVFPPAITAAFFAKTLIFAWTGSHLIADKTGLIAGLLIVGTAFHCNCYIPFAAQLAHGWTNLAFWTNVLYVPVTATLLLVLAIHYGGVGAAVVWLLITTSYMATQIPLMHRRILRGEASQWYIRDVGIPFAACSGVGLLLASYLRAAPTRIGAVATMSFVGTVIGVAALLATPLARTQGSRLWIWVMRPRK